MNKLIGEIFSKLSRTNKEMFLLLFDGYTNREIAERLNISYSAAQKRGQRLRKCLKEKFKNIL